MNKDNGKKQFEVKNKDVHAPENYEKILCPYCSSSRAFAYRKAADIVRCSNCGTVYLRTRLNKESMEILYQSYNTDAPQMFLPKDQNEIKNSLLRRDYWIKEILKYTDAKGNILDIGCGWGAFLDNARTYGFNPRGIEITKKGADFAKTKLHINATSDQFLDTPLEKESFNVITMNHVLEHLPEPKRALEKVFELLVPGGVFCGIVPNIESLCSYFIGDGWEWLDPFYHYTHYSPTTVKKHFENSGFVIEKIYTASGDYNRTQLASVINNYYRPSDPGMIPDIVNKIEANGQGEEIRFIVRRPKTTTVIHRDKGNYSLLASSKRKHDSYSASIVIPVYNKVGFTQKCLETLYSIKNGVDDFEVIVVNNASTDDTADFLNFALKDYHDLKVMNSEVNRRFAGACNLGAENAEGKILVFLNNDTIPQEDWLKFGINKLLMNDEIGIVGSKLLYPDKTIQHCGVEYLPGIHNEYPVWPAHRFIGMKEDDQLVNRAEFVEAVTGACLFIAKDFFRELKGFDEEYVMYFEDLDLCFKSLRAGKKNAYQPKSVVIHFEGKSTPDEALRYKLSANAAKRFFEKWKTEINAIAQSRSRFASGAQLKLPISHTLFIETNKRTLTALIESSRYTEAANLLNDLKKIVPGDTSLLKYEQSINLFFAKSRSDENKKRMSALPDVSIIVLTHNQLDCTKEFVSSLFEHTALNCELIVIDNASTDETPAYLTELAAGKANMRVILNSENLGFPVAVNQGLKEAKGKYIVIANNDIVFTNGWLERLIEVGQSDASIGLVGPISNKVSGLQIDKEAKYESIGEMHLYAKQIREKNQGQIFAFPRLAFLCTLIKKEVIAKIGGLDERFTPGNYEDDDFCLRAQLAGFKAVIAKDVFIHHYGSKSFKAEGEKKYAEHLERNKNIFIDKWDATPDEIWLQNKTIKPRQTLYPIDKNSFKQFFDRAKVHIADNELNLAKGAVVKAVQDFKEGDASVVSYDELLNLAGNICLANNDLDAARQFFEKELESNANSATACYGLGQLFFAREQYDAAKTMFEWTIKNGSSNQTAIDSLSKVNALLGLEVHHNSLLVESNG